MCISFDTSDIDISAEDIGGTHFEIFTQWCRQLVIGGMKKALQLLYAVYCRPGGRKTKRSQRTITHCGLISVLVFKRIYRWSKKNIL